MDRLFLVAALVLVTGCNWSHRFEPVHARPLATGGEASWPILVPEALDARGFGAPVEDDSTMADVRRATRDHLVAAGVSRVDAPIVPAPRTVRELRALLERAQRERLDAVVLVRFHRAASVHACVSAAALYVVGILPGIIVDSVPLSHHAGLGVFEVVAVAPGAGEVLGRSIRTATFGENVSYWGCDGFRAMQDMMGRALQTALEDLFAQRRGGWPLRGGDATEAVLSRGAVRVEGGRFTGPGWSFDAGGEDWTPVPWARSASGWLIEADGREAAFRTSDGVQVTLAAIPTWGEADHIPHDVAGQLGAVWPGEVEERVIDGRPVAIRDSTFDEERQTAVVVATHQLALVVWVRGSPRLVSAWRERLVHMLASVRFEQVVADGRHAD